MATSSSPAFYNYPEPKHLEVPYTPPKAANNPSLNGWPLTFAASLAGSFSFVSAYLYKQNGFGVLHELKELVDVEPRYDPTVIPVVAGETSLANYTTAESLRAPAQDVKGRFYSIADYHEAFKSGKLTPTALVEALLPLIRRDVDKPTKHSIAFLETKIELVKKAAEESTQRYKEGKPLGVLDGIPIGVKDEVDLKGHKKCYGSKKDFTRADNATSWCVAQWGEHGVINMGKLTMHELGMDTTNNNPTYGTPKNPYNPNYYTGGSSGGSAYAVGAGLLPFALGADGGGSIRIPSSYCGIFGLKPTHGRVSGRPTPSLAVSVGVLGPMAANMTDLEIAYRVMATPDPSHPSSSLFPPPNPTISPPSTSRKKLLGICRHWLARADPAVQSSAQKAIDYYTSKLGYEAVEITVPFIRETQLAHAMTCLSEFATNLANDQSFLTAPTRLLVGVGSACPSRDFLQAQKLRHRLMQHMAALFKEHPGLIIVTPTTPQVGAHITSGDKDLKVGVTDGDQSVRSMEYVWMANFLGLPSLSMPVGYAEAVDGPDVPIGLMGAAEWGEEDALIEWGFDGEGYLNEGLEGGRRRPEIWVDVMGLADGKGEGA
ncbi:amidase signature enzyme [Aulographum hederae CBS 113979]|uniref:Amidase signature enzyme n=1 Tax=Aulographum hederae CBS 113979 TaxID=1176131 RepID=A0A6G1H5L3_9PEZI|nr:amidase signature enzyme [Aulographum hederae CBS 113979]